MPKQYFLKLWPKRIFIKIIVAPLARFPWVPRNPSISEKRVPEATNFWKRRLKFTYLLVENGQEIRVGNLEWHLGPHWFKWRRCAMKSKWGLLGSIFSKLFWSAHLFVDIFWQLFRKIILKYIPHKADVAPIHLLIKHSHSSGSKYCA